MLKENSGPGSSVPRVSIPALPLLPIAFCVLSPFGPQAEQGEGRSSAVLLAQELQRAGRGRHECLRASS